MLEFDMTCLACSTRTGRFFATAGSSWVTDINILPLVTINTSIHMRMMHTKNPIARDITAFFGVLFQRLCLGLVTHFCLLNA